MSDPSLISPLDLDLDLAFWGSSSGHIGNGEQSFNDARMAFLQDRPSDAEELLKAAERALPLSLLPLVSACRSFEAFLRDGRRRAASEEVLERIVQDAPHLLLPQLWRCRVRLSSDDKSRRAARDEFEDLLANFPDEPSVRQMSPAFLSPGSSRGKVQLAIHQELRDLPPSQTSRQLIATLVFATRAHDFPAAREAYEARSRLLGRQPNILAVWILYHARGLSTAGFALVGLGVLIPFHFGLPVVVVGLLLTCPLLALGRRLLGPLWRFNDGIKPFLGSVAAAGIGWLVIFPLSRQ